MVDGWKFPAGGQKSITFGCLISHSKSIDTSNQYTFLLTVNSDYFSDRLLKIAKMDNSYSDSSVQQTTEPALFCPPLPTKPLPTPAEMDNWLSDLDAANDDQISSSENQLDPIRYQLDSIKEFLIVSMPIVMIKIALSLLTLQNTLNYRTQWAEPGSAESFINRRLQLLTKPTCLSLRLLQRKENQQLMK